MGVPHRFVGVVATVALAACGRIGFDETVTPDVGEQARATFAVGVDTACAIRSGDVYCWGNLGNGQDGRGGTDVPALVPVAVSGLPKAVQIGVARYHACIVTVDATVWCWGGDEYGRLGNSTATSRRLPGGEPTDPALVPLPGPVAQVSVAHDHVCAVLESGAVWCWGRNHYGQLGRGFVSADTAGLPPAVAIGISDATTISVDEESSCTLRRTGTVACWGDNGQKMIDDTGVAVTEPRDVAGLDGATAVAAGGDHVCAIIDGRVACRGRGENGELGNGMFGGAPITTPVVSTLDDYITLESGWGHVCAVRATGAVMCWGDNDHGVLGDDTGEPRSVPTEVVQLSDAIAVATGDHATCAMRADGRIACWGWGARGLVGDGRGAVVSARNVPSLSNITSLAAGIGFTCASNGAQVWCWGTNKGGQLGTAGTAQATDPIAIAFTWPAQIAKLVAGEAHVCARLVDSSLYCWGANHAGQLGDGTNTDRFVPTPVAIGSVNDVAAGADHTCALGSDDTVRCWGYNTDGQVGDGTTIDHASPVMVLTSAAEIAAGSWHSCARVGGEVKCWGNNGNGELGDGTLTGRTSPTQVPGLLVANIAAGGSSSCARKDDGSGIACWGYNGSGVLNMPGASYQQPTPALSQQSTLFAIGGSTACNGDRCWGDNQLGQVGAGDFASYDLPTVVAGLNVAGGLTTFAISGSHTCTIVIGAGRTVWCWGENASGEVGIGAVSSPRRPVSTVAFP